MELYYFLAPPSLKRPLQPPPAVGRCEVRAGWCTRPPARCTSPRTASPPGMQGKCRAALMRTGPPLYACMHACPRTPIVLSSVHPARCVYHPSSPRWRWRGTVPRTYRRAPRLCARHAGPVDQIHMQDQTRSTLIIRLQAVSCLFLLGMPRSR